MIKKIHNGGCGDSCCLKIQNLSVKIGKDDILKDVSLHIHCGEMVALIGPNGAGKSTLLKAILGQREYEGVVSFSAPGLRHKRAPRIGYVPQSLNVDSGTPATVLDMALTYTSRWPAFLPVPRRLRR